MLAKNTLTALALTGSLALSGCGGERESIDYNTEMATLGNKAIAISAGDDHIWSNEEQVQFFQDNGLKDIVISEGGELCLFYVGEHVDVYSGPGVYLTVGGEKRANRMTGNYVGRISKESLERYIKEKGSRDQ